MTVRKLKVNLEAIRASEMDEALNHGMVRLGSLLVSSRGLTSSVGTSYELTLKDLIIVPEREDQLLGKGSSGSVWKAMDRRNGKMVALKEIKVTSSTRQNEIRRELETLYASGAPDSEHMVDFYGAFYHEGAVFIAMECLDRSLDRLPQPIPTAVLAGIGRSILLGLTYLHRQRHLIHRDLKPSNILCNCHTGEIKISDFGVSSSLEGTTDNAQTFVGTVSYMSPERLKGEQYSFAADVWSFGLVIAEMALGTSPFKHLYRKGETTEARFWTLLQHLSEDGPVLSLPETMEPLLVDFIQLCLQKDPNTRPTCTDLLEHPFLTAVQPESEDRHRIQKWFEHGLESERDVQKAAESPTSVVSLNTSTSSAPPSGGTAEDSAPAAPLSCGRVQEETVSAKPSSGSTLSLDEELQRLVGLPIPVSRT